jgi:anti-sigma B factor antagonist
MTHASEFIREIRRDDATAIVVLAGEVSRNCVPDVERALVNVCRSHPAKLVMNLENVTYIDSSGLAMLITVWRRVREYGGGMALCGLPERIRGIFEVTRLYQLFSIYDTEAEAITG